MNTHIDISNVEIHTERLLLRPFKETDVDDLFEYTKVKDIGLMAGWTPHQSIEDSKNVLTMFIKGKQTFAIVYNDKVIGSIGIEEYDDDLFPEFKDLRARELGFVLSKDYWGRGIMPEACMAVIDYLFIALKLDIIVCGHFLNNNQSRRVQEKLGFKKYKEYVCTTRMDTKEDAILNILKREEYLNEKEK